MKSGIFYIVLSMSLTPMGDALSKVLGETQSPLLIVFLRYLVAGSIVVLFARATGRRITLPPGARWHMVVRTALVMGAMTLLIASLSMVPLASAVGGFLIAPIIATILNVLIFGERLTFMRMFGSGISFIGAFLVLRPENGAQIGMVFSLVGGALLGAFLSLSRVAPDRSDPVSALAVQCLLGAAMIMPFAIYSMTTISYALFWPVIGIGCVTAATHYLTVVAYQRSDASHLAPFFYFNLVAAVVVGFVWFGEMPNAGVIGGLGLIVFGGLASLLSLRYIPDFAAMLRRVRRRGTSFSDE